VKSWTDQDWTVFSGLFYPLSGRTTVNLVSPTLGGGGTVYDAMRYDFVYPSNTREAVKLIRTYAQQDALKNLSVQNINACIESVEHKKAPQIKNIFWKMLSPAEGRQLKVNCGVTAASAYVIVEEKVIGDRCWK